MIKSYSIGVITSYINTILSIFIGLFLTPFILDFVSKEEFGSFSLAQSTILLLGLINFGFVGALDVLAAREINLKENISSYASITATVQLFIGILGCLVGFIISFYFQEWFDINTNNKFDIQLIVILLSFSFLFTIFGSTYSSLMIAFKEIHLNNYLSITSTIINAIIIYVLLINECGILSLAISVFCCQFIKALYCFYRVKTKYKFVKVTLLRYDKKNFKKLFKIGIWFFIGSISVLLIEKFDSLLTGKLIDVETIAVLVITSKLFILSKNLLFVITNNFRPYFSTLLGNSENTKAYNFYKYLRHFSTVSAILLASIIIFINEFFVFNWVGLDLYGGMTLSFVLAINLIYNCWKLPSRAFLTSNLIVKEQSLIGIVEGFINVTLSMYLGKQFGLIGIISGTFISGFLIQSIFYGILLNRNNLETWNNYIKCNFNLLLQFILVSFISYLLINSLSISTNFNFINSIKFICFILSITFLLFLLNVKSLLAVKNLLTKIRVR